MPTIIDSIKRLSPSGTNADGFVDDTAALWSPWAIVPIWPPDTFAVAAHLVNRSGAYSHLRYIAQGAACFFSQAELDRLIQTGRTWATRPLTHDPNMMQVWLRTILLGTPLQSWWEELLSHGHWELTYRDLGTAPPPWWDAAMRLMIASDEAAAGFGFLISNRTTRFGPNLVFDEYARHLKGQRLLELPHLPRSLCKMVPAGEVCVQPKSVTSQVGCTLNNYTHNLSLLPSFREVETRWRYAFEADEITPPGEDSPHPMTLNILVIPYPYSIQDNAFQPGQRFGPAGDRQNPAHALHLDQNWLREGTQAITPARFHDEFLAPLLDQAQLQLPEGQCVHAVVLPELALNKSLALGVANLLAKRKGLECFIAGSSFGTADNTRNVAYASLFLNDAIYEQWWQSKHHRWKVERSQIEGYGLNPVLDPSRDYWEGINVEGRACVVWAFRPGTTMSLLICEDLARREPVQDALRAIGPNLVVALLMDGCQIPSRWPGRYATVLADDPGSSVLTVTSLALVDRANRVRMAKGESTSRSVILWKEPSQLACEPALADDAGIRPGRIDAIELAPNHHAILLQLTSREVRTYSIDGRHDNGATVRMHLMNHQQVCHPTPPAWLSENGSE